MVETIYVPVFWEGETLLDEKALKYFRENKIKSVALFRSIQFSFKEIKEQLEKLGIKVNITKAKRTSEKGQILGCDAYHDSFFETIIEDSDAILYIGDGMFHPKALLLSQSNSKNFKEVIIWDPISKSLEILDKKAIKAQIIRRKRNLRLFLNASKIGILVTLKPGQQHLSIALNLKQKLEKEGKKAYIFLDNTFDFSHFENYPFIDAWVNSACPRIGTDDIVNLNQTLINIKEAFDPIKELDSLDIF